MPWVAKCLLSKILENLGLCDGTTYVGRMLSAPRVFLASGLYTPTPGTRYIRIRMTGAGAAGAGSSACAAGYSSIGGSGGPGAYLEVFLPAPASATITIGAAGIGTTGNVAGGNGGTTSFVAPGISISCPGGTGGVAPVMSSAVFMVQGQAAASPSVTGSVTTLTANGGVWSAEGMSLTPTTARSGCGGSNQMGTGANGVVGGPGLTPYAGFGGGGSGAVSLSSGVAYTGGNGLPGMMEIEEYA